MTRRMRVTLLVSLIVCAMGLFSCAAFMSRQAIFDTVFTKLRLGISPVLMPPAIQSTITRLAMIPLTPISEYPYTNSIFELVLNFLKKRHPTLTIVEREALAEIEKELQLQYSGRVSETTLAQIGKHVGADALLLVQVPPVGDAEMYRKTGGSLQTSIELRVVGVEDGAILFRTSVAASWFLSPPRRKGWTLTQVKQFQDGLLSVASGFALASLTAAFGDNPLGVVPDINMGYSWIPPDKEAGISVWGILEGSPAQAVGLKRWDRLVKLNGHALTMWTDPIQLPAILTIKRDGTEFDIAVR